MKIVLTMAIAGALLVTVIAKKPWGHFRRPTMGKVVCCEKVSLSLVPNIVDYRNQSALGRCVRAIVFITEAGKQYCTNPRAHWVAKAIQELEEAKKQSNKNNA